MHFVEGIHKRFGDDGQRPAIAAHDRPEQARPRPRRRRDDTAVVNVALEKDADPGNRTAVVQQHRCATAAEIQVFPPGDAEDDHGRSRTADVAGRERAVVGIRRRDRVGDKCPAASAPDARPPGLSAAGIRTGGENDDSGIVDGGRIAGGQSQRACHDRIAVLGDPRRRPACTRINPAISQAVPHGLEDDHTATIQRWRSGRGELLKWRRTGHVGPCDFRKGVARKRFTRNHVRGIRECQRNCVLVHRRSAGIVVPVRVCLAEARRSCWVGVCHNRCSVSPIDQQGQGPPGGRIQDRPTEHRLAALVNRRTDGDVRQGHPVDDIELRRVRMRGPQRILDGQHDGKAARAQGLYLRRRKDGGCSRFGQQSASDIPSIRSDRVATAGVRIVGTTAVQREAPAQDHLIRPGGVCDWRQVALVDVHNHRRQVCLRRIVVIRHSQSHRVRAERGKGVRRRDARGVDRKGARVVKIPFVRGDCPLGMAVRRIAGVQADRLVAGTRIGDGRKRGDRLVPIDRHLGAGRRPGSIVIRDPHGDSERAAVGVHMAAADRPGQRPRWFNNDAILDRSIAPIDRGRMRVQHTGIEKRDLVQRERLPFGNRGRMWIHGDAGRQIPNRHRENGYRHTLVQGCDFCRRQRAVINGRLVNHARKELARGISRQIFPSPQQEDANPGGVRARRRHATFEIAVQVELHQPGIVADTDRMVPDLGRHRGREGTVRPAAPAVSRGEIERLLGPIDAKPVALAVAGIGGLAQDVVDKRPAAVPAEPSLEGEGPRCPKVELGRISHADKSAAAVKLEALAVPTRDERHAAL